MSRSRKDRNTCYGERGSGKLGTSQGDNVPSGYLDHDIAQLTKLRSGPNEFLSRAIPGKSKVLVSPVKMLLGREGNYSGRGRFSSADNCHVLSRYLPVNGPRKIDTMQSSAYVSQFSEDGSLFVAAYQESEIRIYNVDNGWKVQKDIRAKSLRWTITDASLSPDQRLLVYSSMSPVVHIVNVTSAATESHANITEIHEGLDFAVDDDSEYSFGIFSVKFSTDGRELVAASSDDAIYVYDLQENKLALRIPSHKVWDRRCFVTKGQAAGVLNGHLEGITFIDSRGDGRYFISNGKDQAIKLWDIRKMSSNITDNSLVQYRNYDWDYRWMAYPTHARNLVHPDDQSLATYKGHSVLRTLIRCYFSPVYSTGQKYIYTGSSDNSVYIYDLVSGSQVAKLDYHEDSVRDCSWHPFYPMLVSSSWDCTIAQWEFPGSVQPPAPPRPTRRRRRQYL